MRARLGGSITAAAGAVVLAACVGAPAAGAWGVQAAISQPATASAEDSVDVDAAGDVWYESASTKSLFRMNTTGTVEQTISTPWTPHAIAVDRASGHVFAIEGDGPGNGPADAVYEYAADGSFIGSFGAELTNAGPTVRLHKVAVNAVTGRVYVSSDNQVAAYDGMRTFAGAITVQTADIEVEPATGDLLAAVGPQIVRYAADLTGAAGVLTTPDTSALRGIGAATGGTFWAITATCRVLQFSPAAAVLHDYNPGCASYFDFRDVDTDALNGGYVTNQGGQIARFATDPPQARFTADPGGPVHRGRHVDFTSTSTDDDGTVVATAWDLNDDGDFTDATGTTAGTTFGTLGDHAVRMRVTDDEGATATRTLVIPVDDQAPVPSMTVAPANPGAGDTVTLDSTSTDPDGTITATAWDLDDDGTYEATGTHVTTSFAAVGDHVVHLKVTDNDGKVVTLDRTIAVGSAGGGGGGVAPVGLSVQPPSVTEGAAGQTTSLVFHVVLDTASTVTTSVSYEVTPLTATDGSDFASRSLITLTFAAGETSKDVRVPVYGDGADEADETVRLLLSAPDGITLRAQDRQTTGTILDDDAPPVLAAAPVSVGEGDGAATLHVTLSAPSGRVVDVTATPNAAAAGRPGFATAGDDYRTTPVVAHVPVGTSAVDVAIPVVDDPLVEDDEAFSVALTSPQAQAPTAATRITIKDDEPLVACGFGLFELTEGTPPGEGGRTAAIPCALSHPTPFDVTVRLRATTTDPAVTTSPLQGLDLVRSDGTVVAASSPLVVTIPRNTTSASFALQAVPDAVPEPTRTLSVFPAAIRGAAAGSFYVTDGGGIEQGVGDIGWVQAAIRDDDPQPAASAPANSLAPAVGAQGTGVGATATCDPGDWTPSGLSFAYAWLRGGVPIAGATAPSYVLTPSDLDVNIACVVTATGAGGSAVARSRPTIVPSGVYSAPLSTVGEEVVVGPVQVALPPSGTVETNTSNTVVPLQIACTATTACAGTVTLYQAPVKTRAAAARSRVLAAARYRVAPNSRARVRVRLTRAGRRLRRAVRATLVVTHTGDGRTTTTRRSVTLRPR